MPAAVPTQPPAPPEAASSLVPRAIREWRLPAQWTLLAPLLGGVAVVFVLLFVQPPFVTEAPSTPFEARGTSVSKVLIWSALAVGLMYALPWVQEMRQYRQGAASQRHSHRH